MLSTRLPPDLIPGAAITVAESVANYAESLPKEACSKIVPILLERDKIDVALAILEASSEAPESLMG